jgi:hypothetical protein
MDLQHRVRWRPVDDVVWRAQLRRSYEPVRRCPDDNRQQELSVGLAPHGGDDRVPDRPWETAARQGEGRRERRQAANRRCGNRHAGLEMTILGGDVETIAGKDVIVAETLPWRDTAAGDHVPDGRHDYAPTRTASATRSWGTRSSSG